jgi:hypothetical protein
VAFGSGGYLKAAGIAVRRGGRPSESKPKPAISVEVSTDSAGPTPGSRVQCERVRAVSRADH